MRSEQLIEAVGKMLAHFLWQGVAVALLLFLALKFCRSAPARYWSSFVALVLLAAAASVTFAWQWPATSKGANRGAERSTLPDPSSTPAPQSAKIPPTAGDPRTTGAVDLGSDVRKSANPTILTADSLPTTQPYLTGERRSSDAKLQSVDPGNRSAGVWLQWVVALWLAGVACFGLRFVRDLGAVRKIRRGAFPLTDKAEWQDRFQRLCQRAGVSHPVRLMQSASIKVPVALGIIRPLVIVPPAMLSGISPAQVDAVLLHELAHIRRHDFLLNLLQSLLETLFFFHPAVWWISAQVRNERENCCDDMAAAACGDVGQYAGSLAALEESCHRVALGQAANGGTTGNLLGRIRRLLGYDTPTAPSMGWAAALFGGLAMLALALSMTLAVSGISLAEDGVGETDPATIHSTNTSMTGSDILDILPISLPGMGRKSFDKTFPGTVGVEESASAAKTTSIPVFEEFQNAKRSALSFQAKGEPLLLLYSEDTIQARLESSKSGEGPLAGWKIDGVINLLRNEKEVRKIRFLWTSEEPSKVFLDGVAYRLRDPHPPKVGKVLDVKPFAASEVFGSIILFGDEPPLGVSRWLKLEAKGGLDEIGRLLDSDAYSAKYYRESRALLRERGAAIEWDAQHPVSHSDGEYVAKLRIYPDGKVVAIYDRRRLEGSMSAAELKDLLVYLKEGSPREPAPETGEDGKPKTYAYSSWNSYQEFVRFKMGEEVEIIRCAQGPDEPIDGKWFDPIRERLNRVVSMVCIGGDEELERFAALAQVELLKRHPDSPVKITPRAMRHAGLDSDGNRTVFFDLFMEKAGVGFPRGEIIIKFMGNGATKLQRGAYIPENGADVDEWKSGKEPEPVAGVPELEGVMVRESVEMVFHSQSIFYTLEEKDFSFEISGILRGAKGEAIVEWSAPLKSEGSFSAIGGLLYHGARWRCLVPDGLEEAVLKMKGPKNALFQITHGETREDVGGPGVMATLGDITGKQPEHNLAIFCAAPIGLKVVDEEGMVIDRPHITGRAIDRDPADVPFTPAGEGTGRFSSLPINARVIVEVTKDGYEPAKAEFDCRNPGAEHSRTMVLRKVKPED